MNSQIIQNITDLKHRYNNNNNTYEIIYNLDDVVFSNILQNIVNDGNKDIKIKDDKVFYKNGLILNIDEHGNMECYNRKMLKYINMNNVRINLFNDRQLSANDFQTSNNYDDSFKQRRIIFEIQNFKISLVIKTRKNPKSKDEDKSITNYEMIIRFNTTENENNLNNIFKYM
jgi:predicted HNH restriction endonuclease